MIVFASSHGEVVQIAKKCASVTTNNRSLSHFSNFNFLFAALKFVWLGVCRSPNQAYVILDFLWSPYVIGQTNYIFAL